MPSIPLHPPPPTNPHTVAHQQPNPLPLLLHTPLGLAILEIQGSLNLPDSARSGSTDGASNGRDGGTGDSDEATYDWSRGGAEASDWRHAAANRMIGRLEFPLLPPGTQITVPTSPAGAHASGGVGADVEEGPWMKKVWLYVGANQRLAGEVRKLGRPVGVVRRRRGGGEGEGEGDGDGGRKGVELEIVEVVKWKLFFGSRPEFV